MAGAAAVEGPAFFRVEPVAERAWAAIAIEGQVALSNSGIVDLGDLTVVFDATLTLESGAALGRAVRQLTGRGADLLVYSHWHGDHNRGASALAPLAIASSRRTREVLRELARSTFLEELAGAPADLAEIAAGRAGRSEADRRTLRAWREGILATPADYPILLPSVVFEEGLTLHGRERSLELRAYPGGHSPSDVVAFLPEARFAFLGDLGMVGYQPWTTDGSTARYLDSLDRIEALAPERFLPGHGAVGDRRDLAEVRRYVRAVSDAAGEPPPAGGDAAAVAPPPFDGWIFSDAFGNNVAQERALRAAGRA